MRLWSSRCRGRRASVEYRRAGPGGPAVHGLPAHDHASRGFTPAELSGDGSGYGSSPMCLEGLRRAARPRRAWILTADDAVVQLLREKVQAPEGCACCLEGAAHSVRLEAVLGVLLWVWGGERGLRCPCGAPSRGGAGRGAAGAPPDCCCRAQPSGCRRCVAARRTHTHNARRAEGVCSRTAPRVTGALV
ncbi:hypothetical protein CUR178_04052 [Leishmania enriettii]|uniref:Uncharacterized protein n=1 Tax=Leishmania enriettii TaxID=5663 RepID=A0A836GU15_LEIEN|nr:hypothetical protein CUR178_04052 [Leishmania enriettii]